MSCYFIVDTYIDENSGRGLYDSYIAKVKPIVKLYGGDTCSAQKTSPRYVLPEISSGLSSYAFPTEPDWRLVLRLMNTGQ